MTDEDFRKLIWRYHDERVDDCVNRLLGDLVKSKCDGIKKLVKKYRIELIPNTDVHRILYPIGSKNKRHEKSLSEYKKTEQYKRIFGGKK
jgi:hypothetical protein